MSKNTLIVFSVIVLAFGIISFIPNPLFGPSGFLMTTFIEMGFYILLGLIGLIMVFAKPDASAYTLRAEGFAFLLLTFVISIFSSPGDVLTHYSVVDFLDPLFHLAVGIVFITAGARMR